MHANDKRSVSKPAGSQHPERRARHVADGSGRPWLGKLRAMPHENVLAPLAVLIELPAPARPHVSWCHSRAFMPQRRKRRDDELRQLLTSDQSAWRALISWEDAFSLWSSIVFQGPPRTPVTSVDGNGPSGTKYVLVLCTVHSCRPPDLARRPVPCRWSRDIADQMYLH
jgi:hypothetical protein